ncbi:MAG: hypothetical protein HN509_03305 [Halobacteriovoraceae bacterium]|jgi:hypothetical protein|nr:hypothetical protein [Halobacteriovoraceae bacterium]MBT5092936.1 hypothetical protein [Halobacteriovoraceae bacterium]
MADKTLAKYITACSLTFKAFNYSVVPIKSKSTLWNFTCANPKGDKHYCVYCVPALVKAANLLKVAIKKLPKAHRLVVVTHEHSDKDLEVAAKIGYTLITLQCLKDYGTKMLEIREKEAAGNAGVATTEAAVDDGMGAAKSEDTRTKLF